MSGPLDTRPRAADDDLRAALDTINDMDLQPFDPDAPTMFAGFFDEAQKSWMGASARGGQLLSMAGAPAAIGIDKAHEALRGVSDAADMLNRARQPFGGLVVPEQTKITSAQDAYFREAVDGVANNAVDYWRPDPLSMGSAAKTMSVIAEVGGSIPQLLGLPAVFLGQSGVAPATDLVRQGVDPTTAGTVGGINLAANALGMRIPAAWGTGLATRLATGAGSNLGIGVATDAASAGVLNVAGYSEQAEGFDPLNAQARGLDVLMGLAFGARAHVDAPRVTPSERDALLTAANADSFQRTTMPGEPAAAGADLRHQEALDASIRGLLNGERVDVSAVLRAEDFALRPELRAAMGEPLRGGAKPVDVQADYEAIGARHGFRTTSTTRSKAENDRVGGVKNSQHLDHHGTARDWSVKGKSQAEIDAFAADLRAAGFEVITKRHGTGPHIHAELPRGGRRVIEAPRESAAIARARDTPMRTEPSDAPNPRPTLESLRTAADALPPPTRATVEDYAAWMAGHQRLAAPDVGADAPTAPRSLAPDREAVQMAHARWQAQQTGIGRMPQPANGETVIVPAMKGDQLVRRSATWVDGEPVAQYGALYSALEDTGLGYYVASPRRHPTGAGAARDAVLRRLARQEAAGTAPRAQADTGASPRAAGAPRPQATQSVPAIASAPMPAGRVAPPAGVGSVPEPPRAAQQREQVAVARAVLAAQPDLRVATGELDANGAPITVTAGELLAMAEQDVHRARLDGDALTAAANCFLRTGT